MNFFLIIIALLLVIPVSIIGFFWEIIRNPSYKYINAYFKKIAISLDQLGNAINGQLFSDTLTKKGDSDKFGNEDLTVSGVLGEEKGKKKLSLMGWFISDKLNKIEKDHVEKAIGH